MSNTAEFPIKRGGPNGDPVADLSLEHDEANVHPKQRVTWRLKSRDPVLAGECEFQLVRVELDDHGESCSGALKYPFRKTPEELKEGGDDGWYDNREFSLTMEPKAGVHPGGCGCSNHRYKGTANVRRKGSDDAGNPVDPHVIFHRG